MVVADSGNFIIGEGTTTENFGKQGNSIYTTIPLLGGRGHVGEYFTGTVGLGENTKKLDTCRNITTIVHWDIVTKPPSVLQEVGMGLWVIVQCWCFKEMFGNGQR
jgi:hypothetical protein